MVKLISMQPFKVDALREPLIINAFVTVQEQQPHSSEPIQQIPLPHLVVINQKLPAERRALT